MTTADILLPCPFCGGPATLKGHGTAPECWVACPCGASSATGGKARVIATWNRRDALKEVVVKPLAWSTKCHDLEEHDPAKTYATGLGGRYCVDTSGGDVLLWDAADGFSWTQHLSVKDAKAAAQADYDVRVRAVLAIPQGGAA